ncbi:MAG: efflux RND transporter periplasmic adaptor subunit [Chloroflexi bacterium]|nr:efflux RND transporter periplasmic adaptor subunit [Chloroflexota bacterium]
MKIFKFIAFAALALTLSACGSTAASNQAAPTVIPTVVAPNITVSQGRLEPIRYTDIALNASGLVSEVLVKEGDHVTAGQVIATLKSNEAQTLEEAQANASKELTSAFQDLRDAQYNLDNFDIPNDFTDMTPQQAVGMTLQNLNAARDAYEPYKYLSPSTNSTGRNFKKQLDNAWAKYRRAIQWMQLQSNVDNAQARVDHAQKDSSALQDPNFAPGTAGIRAALANAEVRAPFAGAVTKLSLKVGEYAAAGQAVVTIADLSSWVVKTTDLTEIDVVSVKEGQPATIKLDAIPSAELKGTVSSISANYGEKQGDIIYEVTVLLNDNHPKMRWGMTAEVQLPK